MASLREYFRNYAKEHKLTISGMEKLAGVPSTTIAKLSGTSTMNTRNFATLLEAFPDMDAYEILGVERNAVEKNVEKTAQVDVRWYIDQIAKKDAIIDSLLQLLNK